MWLTNWWSAAVVAQPALIQGVPEQARFVALLDAHRGIVFKVAATYCSHSEDRRDLAQEISTQLWRAFPSYDTARSFSTWMYRIALNVAISSLRRNGERQRNTQPIADDWLDNVAEQAAHEPDERILALRQFIAALDDFNRALLLLYLEEKTYREIADVLGITETNVATKLNRLKQRIRDGIDAARD